MQHQGKSTVPESIPSRDHRGSASPAEGRHAPGADSPVELSMRRGLRALGITKFSHRDRKSVV